MTFAECCLALIKVHDLLNAERRRYHDLCRHEVAVEFEEMNEAVRIAGRALDHKAFARLTHAPKAKGG